MKQKERTMDYGFDERHHPPALYKLLLKWKNERGYHWHKNPGARYHINDPVLRELRKEKK